MNGPEQKRLDLERATPPLTAWIGFVLILGMQSLLFGGEPIRFFNSKAVVKTPQRSQLTKELEQASSGQAVNPGADMIVPSFSLPVLDPKEQKRQKQAASEKKNWMFNKGDVDEDRETDEAFGIRSEEDFEKDEDEGGSWLSPMRDDRSRSQSSPSRGPTQSRSGPIPRPAPRSDESQSALSKSLAAQAAQARQGGYLAPELRAGASLAPGGPGVPTIGQSAFSSRNLLNLGGGNDGRAAAGSFNGLGTASRDSGLGFGSRALSQSALGAPLSAPASPGFYDRSAGSMGGLSTDSSAWGARHQAGGILGSPAFGDSLSPRSDNSTPVAPQQQFDQRRFLRDFEKPRFPGQ